MAAVNPYLEDAPSATNPYLELGDNPYLKLGVEAPSLIPRTSEALGEMPAFVRSPGIISGEQAEQEGIPEGVPTYQSAIEPLVRPLVDLPRVTGRELELTKIPELVAGAAFRNPLAVGLARKTEKTSAQVLAGLQQATVGAAEFFTSPLGIATLGAGKLPKLAQKGVALAFVAQMAAQSPEMVNELADAFYANDPERLTHAAASLGLNTAFIAGGLKAGTARTPKPPPLPPAEELAAKVDAVKDLAPLTAQVVEQTIKPKEVSDALQVSETAPVLRDVPEQLRPIAEEVPAETRPTRLPRGAEAPAREVPLEPSPSQPPPVAGTEVTTAGEQAGVRGEIPDLPLWTEIAANTREFNTKRTTKARKQELIDRQIELRKELASKGYSPEQIKGVEMLETALPAVRGEVKAAEPVAKEPWQMTRGEFVAWKKVQPIDRQARMEAQVGAPAGVTGGKRAMRPGPELDTKIHKGFIEQAMREDRPVPPEVLADYPDLAKPQPLAKPAPKEAVAPVAEAKAEPDPKRVRAKPERPFDIIDAIDQEVGSINLASAKAIQEDVSFSGAGRKIFKKNGQGIDEATDALRRAGYLPESATEIDLLNAVRAAESSRRTHFKGETPEAKQDAFYKALQTQFKSKKNQPLSVGDLNIGDRFKIKGEEFEVTGIDIDTGDVFVKDGRRFGSQTIPEGADLASDPGTYKPIETSAEFVPKEKAPPLELAKPESIQEQAARFAEEASRAEAKRMREQLAQEAAAPLRGGTGDLGQGDLLEGPKDLFAPPAPRRLQGMGGAIPEEFSKPGDFVSNMFAAIDADRAAMGKPPMAETPRRSWDHDNQTALARMNRDPSWIPTLLADVKSNPRPLLSWENAGVVWHRAKLKAEYNNALKRIAQSFDDGRVEDLAEAKASAEVFERALESLDETVGRGGTGSEAGRSLLAQKMAAGDDFSLIEMRLQKRKAKGGEPLTDAETSEIQKQFDAHQAKIRELEQHLAKERDKLVEAEIKRAFAESQRGPQYEPRVLQYAEKFATFMDKQGEAALARLKARMGRASAGIDPTILSDLAIYGASKITRGLTDFAKWSNAMLQEVGEWVRPNLKEAWDASQKVFEEKLAKVEKAEPAIADKVKRAVKKQDAAERIEGAKDKIETKAAKGEEGDIFPEVQKLVRSLVEQNPKITREALIDEVHGILKEFIPEITRLEAMDAISGRGRFTLPRQDVISKTIRDLKTQTRLVGHQIDVEARRPLPRTGYQPGKMSDIARREEQRLNELKRKYGVVVTDSAKQLSSILSARKTYYRNRISDLQAEIKAREKIVKSKTPSPTDAELETLRSELKTVREEHSAIFQKPGLTDAQRLELSEKAADRHITELERQLRTGEVFPAGKKPPGPTSAALEAKKARIEALKAERAWARDLIQPKADPIEKALRARRAQLTKRVADLSERIANGDFAPKTRKPSVDISDDPVAMRLQGELEQLKTKFQRGLALDVARRCNLAAKTYATLKETLNLPRAIWSAFDISAVGRQGGFIGAAHPIRAAKSIGPMFRALASEGNAFAIEQQILNRPNAPLYARAKLYLASLEEFRLSRMEEIMMSRFSNLVPGVRPSNRAFMTYLNKLRADSFDALLKSRESWFSKPVEQFELEAIANFVNVATGRGSLGRAPGLAEGLATAFWSPRLVTSRFQLLAGQPLYRGGPRVRALIAAEYGRSLFGLAVMTGLGIMAGASVETDPRSSDFLKLKFGDTRIDIFGGLLQNTVLLTRVFKGETKDKTGRVRPAKLGDTAANFLRSKLTPSLGMAADVRDIATGQKPPPGHPQTIEELAKRSIVPLAWGEIYDVMIEEGVPAGTAIQVLSLFGMGVQHYD